MDKINLTDYILARAWGKGESYNKSEITALLEFVRNQEFELLEVVSELPTSNIRANKLYLVYNSDDITGNLFDVFIYVNGEWEQLDSLSFNLSDYYTSNQLDNLLRAKATREDLGIVRESLQATSTSLTNLYNNLSGFNEELIKFDNSNTNLSTDLSKLQDNLLIFISRVNTMIIDIDDLTDGLVETKDSLQATSQSLQNTRTRVEGLGEEVSILGEDIVDAKEEITETKGVLSQTRGELSELSEELVEAKSTFTGFEADLTSLQGQTTRLGTDLTELGTELNTTKSTLSSANNQINNINNNLIPSLESDITGLNNDIARIDETTDGLDTRLTNLNTQLNSTNNSLTGVSNSVTSLTSKTNKLDEDLTGLSEDLNSTNTSLNNARSKLDDLDNNTIPSIQGDITNIQDDISDLGEDIVRLDESSSSLNTRLNSLNTELETTNDSLDTVSTTLGTVQSKTTTLETDVSGLKTNLNNIHNTNGTGLLDTTKTGLENLTNKVTGVGGLEESLANLVLQSNTLDANLLSLQGLLLNADGDLLVTAEDLSNLSDRLTDLTNDLSSLGDYLTTFEGDLTEFTEGMTQEELERFNALNESMGGLFSAIANVKSNVSTLEEVTIKQIQDDIITVHEDVYGTDSNGNIDPSNPQSNGLLKQMEVAQENIVEVEGAIDTVNMGIYGDPNNEEDGGIIGAIVGNYNVSDTALYSRTVSSSTTVNQGIGVNYRIKLTGNGGQAVIRSSASTGNNNFIKLDYSNDKLLLSIKEDNVNVLTNVEVKNGYVDIVGGRVIYDYINHQSIDTDLILTSNLYQFKGSVNVYSLIISDGGIIHQIDLTNSEIDNANVRIEGVEDDIGDVNKVIEGDPSSSDENLRLGLNGQISKAQGDITGAKEEIGETKIAIADTQDSVTGVQKDLFGYETDTVTGEIVIGTKDSPKSGGLANDLIEFEGDVDELDGRISELHNSDGDGLLDVATVQLSDLTNETIPIIQGDINDVNNTVYGQGTINYKATSSWTTQTIDTKDVTGSVTLRFTLYHTGTISLKGVSNVTNGNFSSGIGESNNWSVSDSDNITLKTESSTKYVELKKTASNERSVSITHSIFNITSINSISFSFKGEGTLTVFVGVETNDGLYDTIDVAHENINTTQEEISSAQSEISTAKESLTEFKVDLFGGTSSNPGSSSNVKGGFAKDLNDFGDGLHELHNSDGDGLFDVAQEELNNLTDNTIPTIQVDLFGGTTSNHGTGADDLKGDGGIFGTMNNITNSDGTGSLDQSLVVLNGDPNDSTKIGLINRVDTITNSDGDGVLDTAIDKLDTISNNNGTGVLDKVTNEDGTGSLDVVQKDIYGYEEDNNGNIIIGTSNNIYDNSALTQLDETKELAEESILKIDGDGTDANPGVIKKLDKVVDDTVEVKTSVYGEGTSNYTATTQWKQYTIDTRSLTGNGVVKFTNYHKGVVCVKSVTGVTNGNFSSGTGGLGNWIVSDTNRVSVLTESSTKYVKLDNTVTGDKYPSIHQTNVNYTNVNSISFYVKTSSDDGGVLSVYTGDVTGMSDGLFDGVETVQEDVVEVQEGIGTIQDKMYGNGSFESPQEGSLCADINDAQDKATSSIEKINTVTNDEETGSLDLTIKDLEVAQTDITYNRISINRIFGPDTSNYTLVLYGDDPSKFTDDFIKINNEYGVQCNIYAYNGSSYYTLSNPNIYFGRDRNITSVTGNWVVAEAPSSPMLCVSLKNLGGLSPVKFISFDYIYYPTTNHYSRASTTNPSNPTQSNCSWEILLNSIEDEISHTELYGFLSNKFLEQSSASSTIPLKDTNNGSVGDSSNYARANHSHPKSDLYADASYNVNNGVVVTDSAGNVTCTKGSTTDKNSSPQLYYVNGVLSIGG